MNKSVRVYFSFRSPYSWLALYRVSRIGPGLAIGFELVPCYPLSDSVDPFSSNENKKHYLLEDIERFSDAYGLKLKWPVPFDTDWKRPHSSFVYANDQSVGMNFCLNAFNARFSEGLDIGLDDVIINIAEACSIDPEKTLLAADDHLIQRKLLKGMVNGNREGLFGVPLFIYNGRKYWGNDRLEWLIRDLHREVGQDIPDLGQDPLQHPCF